MLDQEFIDEFIATYLSDEEIASMSRTDALRLARQRDENAALDLEEEFQIWNDASDEDSLDDAPIRDWDLVEDDYPWDIPPERTGWD